MSGSNGHAPALDVTQSLRDRRLVVVGATGFLGKVWLSLLLDRYPDIGHIYLLVRPKKGMDPSMRFWSEVVPTPTFDPLREKMGTRALETFLAEKITPIAGDIVEPLLGIDPAMLDEMRGTVDAVVNAAGLVDFNPPLDQALNVNAFGIQNLAELARDLGQVPILHTSTCYVVGNRSDVVMERDPREFPFPRADELDPSLWDAKQEIQECLDLIHQARARCDDRFRQSHFLDVAKRNLERKNEPSRGSALEDELARVRRKFIERQLADAGIERAKFWGWPNTYTYTKSIGEQVLLSNDDLPITIVRPAVIESALAFPFTGWCEGINTSAPLVYLAMQGQIQYPGAKKVSLDLIPVDYVAAAMVAALVALLEREHQTVYQVCSSDQNPLPMRRLIELAGLAKRRRFQNKGTGNPLVNFLQAHVEPVGMEKKPFQRQGVIGIAKAAKAVSGILGELKKTPARPVVAPVKGVVDSYAKQTSKIAEIMELFLPFTVDNEFRFSGRNTRRLFARLTEEDRARLPYDPASIDWRHYMVEVHVPGLEKWTEPEIEEKRNRETEPLRRHDDLIALLEGMAERFEHAVAFSRLEGDQLTRITYADVLARAEAVAARLVADGVTPGDRVALSGKNRPEWAIAYFGILRAGATAVPFDPAFELEAVENILSASKAKVGIFDETVKVPATFEGLRDLVDYTTADTSLEPPDVEISDQDTASLIYTSGTTGTPKGVMLTHENFTALLASLAPLFKLTTRDRVLSVLPLHHTFEFTCGMLLPFSHGARVIYLDELNGDRLVTGLTVGRVTAMVGVPALWQLLERRIKGEVASRGVVAETAFKLLMRLNRQSGRRFGVDLGKVFFKQVHDGLGGNLRLLISGGAALPGDTQETFAGLGLQLAEGYGLTEASPVLTVAKPSPRNKPGQVGKAIPGVEVKIDNPDEAGVGEVVARGPNVMKGYADDESATAEVIQDGWLRTGDLGTIDAKGRLKIVGRAKEVIVSATGENVYPDDVEELLGTPDNIKELSIVGLADPRGGERVACLAVPEPDDDLDRKARNERALASLRAAYGTLARHQRPTVTHLYEADLPRTATRKVKRREVRAILERLRQATEAVEEPAVTLSEGVAAAIAAVANMDATEIKSTHHLADDLGFDSLMLVELASALDSAAAGVTPDQMAEVQTVADVEALVRRHKTRGRAARKARRRNNADRIDRERENDVQIPGFIKNLVKAGLTRAQRSLYEDVLQTKVTGRGNIPHNRNTIVVANHCSHLDMGLVKIALGSYGKEIVALAAQDYFFEDKWRRAYFANFTNMASLDRKSGLRKSLQQAGDLLEQGKTLLIFPEGTRTADGVLREFKPAIGNLALEHGVDILPVYLWGTHRAMKRGSVIPKDRRIGARIGPVLTVADLERLTRGKKTTERYREAARLAHRAVAALRDGGQLDISKIELEAGEDALQAAEAVAATPANPMKNLFTELEERFVAGAVAKPISYYFKLGEAPDDKWTVALDATVCMVQTGKPDSGRADCVLKTDPEMFTRIVKERYTPSVKDFMSGKVKTNDVELLKTFQRAFNL